MALNKIDNVKFDSLSQTLSMLLQHGTELEVVKTMLAPQISDFEESSKHKVKFVIDGETVKLTALNLSRDYLRTRNPNDEQQVLRTKVEGVSIEVKLFKKDDFLQTNEDVVNALRALADEVSDLSVELNTLGTSDVRNLGQNDSELDSDDSDDLDELDSEDTNDLSDDSDLESSDSSPEDSTDESEDKIED